MTGALDNQPSNINMMSPLGFRFVIKRLPTVNYFCQTVAIPAISMPTTDVPNILSSIPFPGTKLIFEPLIVRFKVDEDLKNYLEIYNWLVGLGHPVSFSQTAQLSAQSPLPLRAGSHATLVSDGTLVILTSHKNPSHYVTFRDLFPISLTELTFDSTDSDVVYLEATATFRYQRFEIEALN